MPDTAIIKRLSPYCRVYSSRRGKLQEYPDVYNGIRHYRVALIKSVPCYLRFGRFQVRFFHPDQVKTCRRCGVDSHVARDCKNQACFNCDGVGHTSKNCPEKTRCCICKSEAHMAIDCDLSWYRRPVLDPNPAPPPDGQPREPADQVEPVDQAEAADQVEPDVPVESDIPVEHVELVAVSPAPCQEVALDLPHGSGSAPMDESPDPVADSGVLDSQGLLISQDTPADLLSRPAVVSLSTVGSVLSEDLCLSDDNDDEDEEDPEDTLASTPLVLLIFPNRCLWRLWRKSLKLLMESLDVVLQQKYFCHCNRPCGNLLTPLFPLCGSLLFIQLPRDLFLLLSCQMNGIRNRILVEVLLCSLLETLFSEL